MGKRPGGGLARRITPVTAQMLGQNPRRREQEHEADMEVLEGNELDKGESFPQYCMACERQFIPYDHTHLYCSEACRQDDENPPRSGSSRLSAAFSDLNISGLSPTSSYLSSSTAPEPRDIIPRACPSRPSSMHFSPQSTPQHRSEPHLPSRTDRIDRIDTTVGGEDYVHVGQYDHQQPSSAVSALASLNESLGAVTPQGRHSPPPSSPSGLWEFVRNIAVGGSPWLSSTCGQAPREKGQHAGSGHEGRKRTSGGSGIGWGGSSNTAMGTARTMATTTMLPTTAATYRPLPLRRPGYPRTKSIELVTPML